MPQNELDASVGNHTFSGRLNGTLTEINNKAKTLQYVTLSQNEVHDLSETVNYCIFIINTQTKVTTWRDTYKQPTQLFEKNELVFFSEQPHSQKAE